jgi:hypothetical protein
MTFRRFRFAVLAAGLGCSFLASAAHARIVFGQVDTFSDGTNQSWIEGQPSTNPPVNQPTGGPAGVGDAWLRNQSTGGGGPGARQVMFNLVQWTGDYNAAGVNRISADMANFGTTTLNMRVAVQAASIGQSWWVSRTAVVIPPGGGWREVTFDLTPQAMADLTGGIITLGALLNEVSTLRILSATNITFQGSSFNSVLGVDNIRATAVPEPAGVGMAAIGMIVAMVRPVSRANLKSLSPNRP